MRYKSNYCTKQLLKPKSITIILIICYVLVLKIISFIFMLLYNTSNYYSMQTPSIL